MQRLKPACGRRPLLVFSPFSLQIVNSPGLLTAYLKAFSAFLLLSLLKLYGRRVRFAVAGQIASTSLVATMRSNAKYVLTANR